MDIERPVQYTREEEIIYKLDQDRAQFEWDQKLIAENFDMDQFWEVQKQPKTSLTRQEKRILKELDLRLEEVTKLKQKMLSKYSRRAMFFDDFWKAQDDYMRVYKMHLEYVMKLKREGRDL